MKLPSLKFICLFIGLAVTDLSAVAGSRSRVCIQFHYMVV
jgi:hypothetical protein